MNVLVISTVSYRSNGIANVIRNLYLNKTFKNEEISFLFPDKNDESMIAEIENHGFTVFQFSRYERGVLSYYKYLKKIIREGAFDIVHIHGNSHAMLIELIASASLGIKVRICHSHNTTCNHIVIHKLLFPFFNLLCTNRLACGVDAGRWMYGKKKFEIINNGIDTNRFCYSEVSRRQIRNEYNISEDVFVIGHVGNLNTQKNQTMLIDIINELSKKVHCKCLLVGEGEKKKELEDKIDRLLLKDVVCFCGVTDDVPSYLSAMDIIAMPSLYEGLPLSLVEEQANGLTCVVSDAITREADKTGNVIFMPKSSSVFDWVNTLMANSNHYHRKEKSEEAIASIRCAGYDIREEPVKLKKKYEEELCQQLKE